MKKKILNIVLAAAVTPFLCCCTDNFEEYNTNPYEPHSLNPVSYTHLTLPTKA